MKDSLMDTDIDVSVKSIFGVCIKCYPEINRDSESLTVNLLI